MQYVILHEKAHIRRGDHCLKLVGALLLSIYWFHPLVWLAYALLCRDIELACDEKVIRHLDRAGRAEVRTAHTGWNTIVLYQSEGADYLLQYQPTMYQGIGSYTCTMLSLEGGREVVENEWSTEFTLPVRQLTWKMRGFAEQVNFMLKNGTVLLSAGEEGCVIEPKPGTEVGQVYPVIFEPKEASFEKISSEEKQDTTKGYSQIGVPLSMPPPRIKIMGKKITLEAIISSHEANRILRYLTATCSDSAETAQSGTRASSTAESFPSKAFPAPITAAANASRSTIRISRS